jgi:hypothetical protein
MTLEYSLRRRSVHARVMAFVWLSLACLVLGAAAGSLPWLAQKTWENALAVEISPLNVKSDLPAGPASGEQRPIVWSVLIALEMSLLGSACYVFARAGFSEVDLAARYNGLADALCVAGDDLGRLEQAAAILVPKASGLKTGAAAFSAKDVQSLAELVKPFK